MVQGNGNYERILEKISKASGLSREEVERRIEAKKTKLSGLISMEGAAQVVASELGISFENEKLKIDELLPSMRKVNVIGKIISISPIRAFTTKKGEQSKVVNMTIADETSNIKTVLWDTNLISLIEKGKISVGSVVEIGNASMRDNEVHLGSFSQLKASDEVLNDVKTEKIIRQKNISELKVGENTGLRAFVLQIFEPRFFNVCPECSKKVTQEAEVFICEKHGKVLPQKRAVSSIVIDDGTDSVRAVLFNEALNKLGFSQVDDADRFAIEKEGIIGREMLFTGNVRNNAFFNNHEIIVDDIKEINPDELIAELEKN